jgi:hypothetical protein
MRHLGVRQLGDGKLSISDLPKDNRAINPTFNGV